MPISSDILAAVIGALIAVFATIFLEYLRNRGKKKSNSLALAYALEMFAVMSAEQIATVWDKMANGRDHHSLKHNPMRWPLISVPDHVDFSSLDHQISAQVLDLLLKVRIQSADLPYATEHLDPTAAALDACKVYGDLGCTALAYAKQLRKAARLPASTLIQDLKIADILVKATESSSGHRIKTC